MPRPRSFLMRTTRRPFVRTTAGSLLVAGGGSFLLARRAKADDMPSTVEDALGPLIDVWNQFGSPDSPNFGTSWASDPATASLVSSAYDALSNAWASDGSDSQVQSVLSDGSFQMELLNFDAPFRPYLELVQRRAQVQLSDVLAWYADPNMDWLSAMDQLNADPLSGIVQSLGWAAADPQDSAGNIATLGPAAALAGGIARTPLFGSKSR